MNNIIVRLKKKITPWIFAFTASILAYGLLFLLFSPAKIAIIDHSPTQPKIIMFPSDSINPDQNQLHYWLKNNDPTLIIQPRYKYGYSSILNSYPPHHAQQKSYNNSLNMSYMFSPLFFFKNPYKIEPLSVDVLSQTQLLSQLILKNESPTVPEFKSAPTIKLKPPYVKDYYSGKLINVKFNDNINELIRKYNPAEPTILNVGVPSKSIFFPIINIVSSCGSSKLDNEAIKTLTTYNFTKDNSLVKKQIDVYVKWK